MLCLASFALFLCLLVFELSVVQKAADWRDRGGCYFNEVELAFARQIQGLLDRHGTQTVAFIVDYKDLTGPDPVVDSKFSGYRRLS